MADRRSKDPERESVQRSRRRLEDALEETRWGLQREFGWKLGSKSAAVLLVAIAAGFVVGQVVGISGGRRTRDRKEIEPGD